MSVKQKLRDISTKINEHTQTIQSLKQEYDTLLLERAREKGKGFTDAEKQYVLDTLARLPPFLNQPNVAKISLVVRNRGYKELMFVEIKTGFYSNAFVEHYITVYTDRQYMGDIIAPYINVPNYCGLSVEYHMYKEAYPDTPFFKDFSASAAQE